MLFATAADYLSGNFGFPANLIVTQVWAVLHWIPIPALTVRRLRDTGKSVWWFPLIVVPIAGILIFAFALMPSKTANNHL